MENKITAVYPLLAGKDKYAIAMAGNVIRKEMSGMSTAQIIKFEESFRQSTSMEWTVDWSRINLKKIKKAFDSEEDYLWALKLGTFHPNGYFRIRKRESSVIQLPR